MQAKTRNGKKRALEEEAERSAKRQRTQPLVATLPFGILAIIHGFLEVLELEGFYEKELAHVLRLVNCHWDKWFMQSEWSRPSFFIHPKNAGREYTRRVTNGPPHLVRRASFFGAFSDSSRMYSRVMTDMPFLQRLWVPPEVVHKHHDRIEEHCAGLHSLSVKGEGLPDPQIVLQLPSLPNLSSLEVRFPGRCDLSALRQTYPGLQRLLIANEVGVVSSVQFPLKLLYLVCSPSLLCDTAALPSRVDEWNISLCAECDSQQLAQALQTVSVGHVGFSKDPTWIPVLVAAPLVESINNKFMTFEMCRSLLTIVCRLPSQLIPRHVRMAGVGSIQTDDLQGIVGPIPYNLSVSTPFWHGNTLQELPILSFPDNPQRLRVGPSPPNFDRVQ